MKPRTALTILITAVLVAACSNPQGLELGTLEIVIAPGAASGVVRTISSPPGFTVTSYRIHGTTDGAEFTRTVDAGVSTVTEHGLEPGEWTISVDALDGEQIVLNGSSTVTIRGGLPTEVEIVLAEPAGNGTLTFELRWPAGRANRPAVDATLTPLGEDPVDAPFSVSRLFGRALYHAELPAGYYELTVVFRDRNRVVWGNAYAVRIYVGTTASETVSLTGADF